MKKIISIGLCVVLLMLTGCRVGTGDSTSIDSNAPETLMLEDNDYRTIETKAEKDVRYKWIKALLDKDFRLCADLIQTLPEEYRDERDNLYYEWYKAIESLEFGEYSVEEIENDDGTEVLSFSFEITNSDLNTLPIGKHLFHVSEGVFSVCWEEISQNKPTETVDNAVDIIDFVMVLAPHIYSFNTGEDFLANQNNDVERGMFYLIDYWNRKCNNNGEMTLEDVQEGANNMFGVTDYIPPKDIAESVNGVYSLKSPGAYSAMLDIINLTEENNGEYSCYVRFYADPMKIIESYEVKYTLEKSTFGLGYKVKSVETISSGEYSPLVWVN